MAHDEATAATLRLLRPVDPSRDHLRGVPRAGAITVVGYEDFLCPYCRRLREVYRRLREALGDRLVYVFRHFPNERAHPGAELAARAAEAAGRQGKFDAMHDRLFDREPRLDVEVVLSLARELGLDTERFERDLESREVRARVDEDLSDGRRNGVTATPTLFVDGLRYDGAWDFYSLLEALERPVAARVHRRARVFASLPTSAGLVLLVTAMLALGLANSPFAEGYERLMEARVGVGPLGKLLALSVREWVSEGLLSVFFLLVGLEIRRELTTGALRAFRAALLPIVAAVGGVLAPALIYALVNPGPTRVGWPVPTATDVAFTLALLAVLGERVPASLRVFVAALAVVDDMLSVVTLAVASPHRFELAAAAAAGGVLLALVALNRARVYRTWPYFALGVVLWLLLHALGVHAALAGVLLALCLPTLPPPSAAPLLAQAATALAELEHAEREARREGRDERAVQEQPVWEWAARNLSAATNRLASPAERVERAVAPWGAYVVLPAFAFSATGIRLFADLSGRDARSLFAGIVIALVLGKPLGILVPVSIALATRAATPPEGVSKRQLVGAAVLCGVSDTLAFVVADQVFSQTDASVAKLAVLTGSLAAGTLGALVLWGAAKTATPLAPRDARTFAHRSRSGHATTP